MTNTVLIKRSSTPGSVPVAGNLSLGELALNYADGNLFYKNSGGSVTVIASNQFSNVTGNVTANNGMFTTIVNSASFTGGLASVTGNITANNGMFTNIVNVASHTGAVVSVSGNVTGGNLNTAGQISATGNVTGGLLTATANVAIRSRGILFLNDSDNSNYVGLRSPASLAGDYLYTLPTNYGNNAQVLNTNGAGTLSWVDQSGGGSSATSYPNSTVQPVPGSDGNFDLSYNYVQTSQEIPFESSATDPFGVNLGEVYSMMDPVGEILASVDFGVLT